MEQFSCAACDLYLEREDGELSSENAYDSDDLREHLLDKHEYPQTSLKYFPFVVSDSAFSNYALTLSLYAYPLYRMSVRRFLYVLDDDIFDALKAYGFP